MNYMQTALTIYAAYCVIALVLSVIVIESYCAGFDDGRSEK